MYIKLKYITLIIYLTLYLFNIVLYIYVIKISFKHKIYIYIYYINFFIRICCSYIQYIFVYKYSFLFLKKKKHMKNFIFRLKFIVWFINISEVMFCTYFMFLPLFTADNTTTIYKNIS